MFTSCIGVFILWTLTIRGLFRNRVKLMLNGEHELHGLARAVLIRFLLDYSLTSIKEKIKIKIVKIVRLSNLKKK